eukprot:Hpha_TRINITY_DN16811_c2_g3::TRINITY_DN16811_c2_g3_i1::g.151268::m.151268
MSLMSGSLMSAPLNGAPLVNNPHQMFTASPSMVPRGVPTAVNPAVAPRHPAPVIPDTGPDLSDDSPVEIAHQLGFNGGKPGTAVYHPTTPAPTIVYGVGSLVAIRQLDDPHSQYLLRGHDATVSAVDISPSGRLIASAQDPSRSKEGTGYILVWDFESRTPLYRLKGHTKGTFSVKFSYDDRWIASSGADGRVLIWDMQNGECAGGVKDVDEGELCSSVAWGEIHEAGTRRQAYELTAAYNSGVRGLRWGFEVRLMQYTLQQRGFQVPGAGGKLGGFVRNYLCSALVGGDLLCGTASGDVVVFGTRQGLYRTSFTVSSAGALSICAPHGDGSTVFVGAGDGRLRKISGADREWALQQEIQLSGGITSLSSSADGAELIAATSAGVLYRVLTADLGYTVAAEAHTGPVVAVAVPHDRSDRFASCSNDGVRVWDLSEYTTVCRFEVKPHTPSSLAFSVTIPSLLLTGWSDGAVRALDTNRDPGTLQWQVHTAHRGPVSSIAVADSFFVTGGEDGNVRVWALQTRECVACVQDHKRGVSKVLVDNTTTRIVHSISADRCLFTYDLAQKDTQVNSKQPRRIAAKNDATGAGFTGMCQRRNHEREIVGCTAEGRIVFYDIDYDRPVHVVVDRARIRANAVAVSPQGGFLCVAQQDGIIVLYSVQSDTADGINAVTQARCHSADVCAVEWTRDGKQLVTAGGGGDICVWNFFLPS